MMANVSQLTMALATQLSQSVCYCKNKEIMLCWCNSFCFIDVLDVTLCWSRWDVQSVFLAESRGGGHSTHIAESEITIGNDGFERISNQENAVAVALPDTVVQEISAATCPDLQMKYSIQAEIVRLLHQSAPTVLGYHNAVGTVCCKCKQNI